MTSYLEYAAACRVLGVPPLADPHPAARARHLPAWYVPEMTASRASRERLGVWARATPRAAWSQAPDPAGVLDRLHTIGDPALPPLVARVLVQLPPPLVDHVTRACTFLLIGRTCAGFCGPRFDPGDPPRPYLVALAWLGDEAQFAATAVHESCHAWLEAAPTGRPARPR